MRDESRVDGFTKLIVWQKADELFYQIVADIEWFPKKRVAYIIEDQLIRCIGSISANIAEGFGAQHGGDFPRMLMIARKESSEAVNWLIKAKNLHFITEDRYNIYRDQLEEIRKMINSLAAHIRRDNQRVKRDN